jgi:protein-S-isoprenylcysteine O-methyltransferase Ste14
MTDLAARVAVGILFVLLSKNLLTDFLETHRITGLLLLVSESLVVVLTIVRRRAAVVDRSLAAGTVTLVSVVGPFLLRTNNAGLVADQVTAAVSCAGLCLVIAGKLALGRSFGIVPANRGVVAQGPYLFMRHPIYAGYIVTHAAFLVAHPGLLNVAIGVCADVALILRALREERLLEGDERYRTYCSRVEWHLVPGLF